LTDETKIVDNIPEDRRVYVKMIDGTMRYFDRLYSVISESDSD